MFFNICFVCSRRGSRMGRIKPRAPPPFFTMTNDFLTNDLWKTYGIWKICSPDTWKSHLSVSRIQVFLGADLHTFPWFVDGVRPPFLEILNPRQCSVAHMFFKTEIKLFPPPQKKDSKCIQRHCSTYTLPRHRPFIERSVAPPVR